MIIINGGSRCNGAFFAKHLINPCQNERAHVEEIRGLAAKNIGQAFYEMKAIASGTPRCKNFFYHANLNPEEDEILTPEQWERAVDGLEKNLNLEGQPRFVVEHKKKGRVHRHVIWSRIDVDKMTAIKMDKDFAKHQSTARQLEKEFGLKQGRSVLGPDADKENRPERRPKQWEVFRGQVKGVNVKDLKEEITGLWNGADNAEAFLSALEGRGYILAQGDSRAYCIIDRNGDVHSLARRIEGAKAADVKEKLGSIDPKTLPHVKVAAAYQREQNAQKHKQQEESKAEEQRKGVIEQEETRQQDTVKEAEDSRQQAIEEAERWKQSGLDEERRRDELKKQADLQAEQAKTLEDQQERVEMQRAAVARQIERAKREAAQQERYKEGEIKNAANRYGQAVGQYYNILSPYETLARSAMAEYGALMKEQESLDRQIARAKDPIERQRLQLRKEIEGAEYMALTSERIAGQSEIIVDQRNSPEAVKQRERAKGFREQAQALRKEYRELGAERGQGKEQAGGQARKEEPPRAQAAPQQKAEQAPSTIKVEERTAGRPRGAEQSLGDFVKTIPEKQPRREFTKEELRNDPEARRAHSMQQKDDKNRTHALESIRMNMRTGKNLNTNDIRRLNCEDLDGINRHGEKHLKTLVQQHEKDREKDRGLER